MNESDPNPSGKKWLDSVVPIGFIAVWIGFQAFVLPQFGVGL